MQSVGKRRKNTKMSQQIVEPTVKKTVKSVKSSQIVTKNTSITDFLNATHNGKKPCIYLFLDLVLPHLFSKDLLRILGTSKLLRDLLLSENRYSENSQNHLIEWLKKHQYIGLMYEKEGRLDFEKLLTMSIKQTFWNEM